MAIEASGINIYKTLDSNKIIIQFVINNVEVWSQTIDFTQKNSINKLDNYKKIWETYKIPIGGEIELLNKMH